MYGFDTFTIAPALTVSYGSRYARYDFLEDRNLVSPRVEVTVIPAERMRISAGVSHAAQAPSAQEFLAPGDTGIWLPPQRTFSSIRQASASGRAHDPAFGRTRARSRGSTVSTGVPPEVDDQLVALRRRLPSQPTAKIGHHLAGSAGDVSPSAPPRFEHWWRVGRGSIAARSRRLR
jgi:hypothetical protein